MKKKILPTVINVRDIYFIQIFALGTSQTINHISLKQKSFSKKKKISYRITKIRNLLIWSCRIGYNYRNEERPVNTSIINSANNRRVYYSKGWKQISTSKSNRFYGGGGGRSNNKPHVETSLSKIQTRVYTRTRICSRCTVVYIHIHIYIHVYIGLSLTG